MKYKVSVIIPVYNCEKYIERAVRSVISQPNFNELQVILVDDGSVDGSSKICDNFSAQYSNIFTYHRKNSGVSAARNFGISVAEGEWISFIDSDDYILNGFFEKMLDGCCTDMVFCSYKGDRSGSDILDSMLDDGIYEKDDFTNSLYPVMASDSIFYTCWNKLYKKSLIDEFDVKFPVGVKLAEDMVFVYDYVRHINSFRFVKEPLYYYFLNQNGASNVVKKSYETFKMIYTYLTAYFNDIGYSTESILHDYLYRTLNSVYTASAELNIFSAIKYVKGIIFDNIFYDNYVIKRCYKNSACKINSLMDKYIIKKNPFAVVVCVKINEIRSKIKGK